MSQDIAFSLIRNALWMIVIVIWVLYIIEQRKITRRAEETARMARENRQIIREIKRQ